MPYPYPENSPLNSAELNADFAARPTLTEVATLTNKTLSGATLTGTTTLPGSGSLTSGGVLQLGYATAVQFATSSAQQAQVVGSAARVAIARFSANALGSSLYLAKSRGSTATAGAVVANDTLGEIDFFADDGSSNGEIPVVCASISIEVDGTVSTGIVPARIVFNTRNSAGTLGERWEITSGGLLAAVGRTSSFPAFKRSSAIMQTRLADDSDYAAFEAATVRAKVFTVATLPTVGTAGKRAGVSDANATTFLSTVAAGGANNVPVYDNGTNWVIG